MLPVGCLMKVAAHVPRVKSGSEGHYVSYVSVLPKTYDTRNELNKMEDLNNSMLDIRPWSLAFLERKIRTNGFADQRVAVGK